MPDGFSFDEAQKPADDAGFSFEDALKPAKKPTKDEADGMIVSGLKGAGKGFGTTVLSGQELIGQGMKMAGIPGGEWLIEDARKGLANLNQDIAPDRAAHPFITSLGELAGTAFPASRAIKGARALVGAARTVENAAQRIEPTFPSGGPAPEPPTSPATPQPAVDLGGIPVSEGQPPPSSVPTASPPVPGRPPQSGSLAEAGIAPEAATGTETIAVPQGNGTATQVQVQTGARPPAEAPPPAETGTIPETVSQQPWTGARPPEAPASLQEAGITPIAEPAPAETPTATDPWAPVATAPVEQPQAETPVATEAPTAPEPSTAAPEQAPSATAPPVAAPVEVPASELKPGDKVMLGDKEHEVEAVRPWTGDEVGIKLVGDPKLHTGPADAPVQKVPEPTPEPTEEEKAKQPIEAHGGPWSPVMKDGAHATNEQGVPLYENPNGVRAHIEDGVPYTEPTTETDKGLAPKNPDARKPQFMVAGEGEAKPKNESQGESGGKTGETKPGTPKKPKNESRPRPTAAPAPKPVPEKEGGISEAAPVAAAPITQKPEPESGITPTTLPATSPEAKPEATKPWQSVVDTFKKNGAAAANDEFLRVANENGWSFAQRQKYAQDAQSEMRKFGWGGSDSEEPPDPDAPISWANAKPGDDLPGLGKLVRKGIPRKKDATELAEREGGSVILDGPNKWAVVKPSTPAEAPKAEETAPEPTQKERYDAIAPADTPAATGEPSSELKSDAETAISSPQETSDATSGDRPRDDSLGQPGGRKPRASGSRAGKSKGKGRSEVLAPEPSEDAGPTESGGDRGEDGVRPGSESEPGAEGLPAGGDAADGRGGTGDEGLADDGSGDGTGAVIPAAVRPNFHIDDPERLVGGTPKVRFARNKAAIETMATLEEEQRAPTQEELETIAGYIGWGSFGQDLFQGTFERPFPRPGWDAESKWLRDHLGKENWESAQRSIINAHYTDPPTVQAMWDMVQRMGFNGGRILEPSMGIGNFFGMMPRDIMHNSTLTGIELDNLTGEMAKTLYPQAGVFIKGYQDSKTPDGFYDLVIGNWPFAAQSPPDRRYDKLSPTLHNYFFLKALDQTRPGGLVVGITSSGTMDSAGRAARIEMAKKGELIAAFRLPSGAFEKYAGTSVVTDIIILRKRAGPPEDVMAEPWINASDMETPSGQKIRVNEYFQSRPNNVLGTLDFGHGTTQGRAGMIVHRPDDLMDKLQSLAGRLPEDGYHPKIRGGEPRFITNSTQDRQNSITIAPDGNLYQVAGERLMLLEDVFKGMKAGTAKAQKDREEQVRALVKMRKAYGGLIDAERDGLSSTEVFRERLREQYEAFTKAHGRIVNSAGASVMRRVKDPSLPILESLELPDGTPARILSEPVVRARRSIDNPSVSDAYVMARNESANLDMDRVAELAKRPRAEVEKQLLENGAVLRTPGGGYEPSDGYLSGNVRRKLREAQDAVERGEDMQASVDALTKALPPTVPYYQIEPKFGATWIGDDFYKQFIGDLLGLRGDDVNQIHVRFAGGRWKVTFDNDRLNRTPEATSTHGHPRYRFDKLLRAAMGNTLPQIFDRTDDGGKVYNQKASEEVALKIQGIREKFQDWAWKDPERKIQLEGAFNEVMNAIAKPHFDGSFMDMSGMALRRGDDPFSLRRHQINAIWRGVNLGRGLFAHEVGTGKTYTIAGIAIEGRRYGKFNKPLVFAHNANSAAVAREMQEMYPGAKILYLDNLSPETIAASMYRIANEDWDAVVMPHSLIDRMSLTRETLMELAQEEITALENEAMEAAREDNVRLTPEMMDDPEAMKKIRSVTAKQLVKQREAIIANIEKQANRASREGAVPFEKLGVDAIIVDEAHEFKKPPVATQMKVKGLNTQTSDRSIALRFLTGYVKKNNNGNGVFMFTGTPVTNSLNEIFNMSRYFMDDTMGRDGIADWDAWFNTFADATPDLELTAAGEFDVVTRLSSFVNVDELVRLMSQFTDVVQAKDMPEFVDRATSNGKTLSSPDLNDKERDFLENGYTDKPSGRPYKRVINDVGEITTDQRRILDILQEQSRFFKNASRKARREMMLAGDERVPIQVETNAANASLDARMYDPEAVDDPNNKINRVTKNVLEVYGQPKAAQMIFVDRGYNGGKKNPNFEVVGELIQKLVAGGIPREEIAVVAGDVKAHKKKELADQMNSGKIRVMIGQSGTMGVGVNAQVNLRALHHMDAPWRPGDLEQRNGRGHRQGNRWNTVLEYRYITEGIDGRRWQVLTSKDRFIKQFINAFNDDSGKRIGTIEGDAADISDNEDIMNTLSAAAGDPRLMLREKTKSDINRLERRERVHTQGVVDAADRARAIRQQMEFSEQQAKRQEGYLKTWDDAVSRMEAAAKEAGDKHRWYEATVEGRELHSSQEIQDAFDAAVLGIARGDQDRMIGTINGFKIVSNWYQGHSEPYFYVIAPDGNEISDSMKGLTVQRILGAVTSLRNDFKGRGQRSQDNEATIKRLVAASQENFAQADKLAMKRQQLAQLEDDLAANPIPPPAWLRHGAPIDAVVWVNGQERIVRGHRMSDDYYLVTDEGDVPYLDATDENGIRVFEVRPAPTPPPAPQAAPSPGQATD